MGVSGVDADGFLVDIPGDITDGVLPLPASFGFWQSSEVSPQDFTRTLQVGKKDESKDAKAFRYYHTYGTKQYCDVDLDCRAQPEFQAAFATGDVSTCKTDATCQPLVVEGYSGTGFMPGGSLFPAANDRAVEDFTEADIYSYGLGKVVMKPSDVDFVKDGKTIKTREWTITKIYDHRQNCPDADGNLPNTDDSISMDCRLESPKESFYIGFQVAAEAGTLRPKLYASMPHYKLEKTKRTEELRKTPFASVGPYHPEDRVEFAKSSPTDVLINLKYDTLMGRQVHGDKAIMYNVRIQPDMAFPSVQDALVPALVAYQFGTTNKEEHEALAKVQTDIAGLEEMNPFPMLMILGIILALLGFGCCAFGFRSGGPKVVDVQGGN